MISFFNTSSVKLRALTGRASADLTDAALTPKARQIEATPNSAQNRTTNMITKHDHLLDWRSSSAPKKVDAAFKISFARASSRFSFFNAVICAWRSSFDPAGTVRPVDIGVAFFTHPYNVEGANDIFDANDDTPRNASRLVP